jgi:DNA-binding GntR family transcriptional regulator
LLAVLSPVDITPTKDEQVYDRLRRGIVSGHFAPGSELNLTTIAGQLGVSRVPVMRACQRLIGEGFLETTPRRSIAVSALTEQRVKEEFALLTYLEITAAEAAIARQTPELAKEWRRLIEAQRRLAKRPDKQASIDANLDFHRALWDCVESPYVRNLLAVVWDHLEPARNLAAAGGPWDRAGAIEEHQTILDAIVARDADAAAAAVSSHRQSTVDRVLAAVRTLTTS